MATLGSLKAKLLKGKIHATDPVESAVYTQFKKLSLDTTLARLNRILDTDHFALVVHNQRLCKSTTLTKIHYLTCTALYCTFF